MDKQSFESTVKTIFEGMEKVVSTRTVVGDPQFIGDTTIVPLVDVSFGMGAGAMSGSSRDNGGGGMGAKISPAAVLLIAKDGTTKLVNMKSQDAVAKIIDMAPDIITKIKSQFGPENNSDDFAE